MNHKLKAKSSFTNLKNSKEAHVNDDEDSDNDDEELEALRLAALQSLQYKKTLLKDLSISNCKSPYNCITPTNSDCSTVLNNKFSLQNKNSFCHFQQKSDLIEIVPKDVDTIVADRKSRMKSNSSDPLHYFHCKDLKDKTQKNVFKKTCSVINSEKVVNQMKEIKAENIEHERKIGKNIYDDDIILMSDHEEEDSLERLMDEMEKEINNTQLSVEKGTNKCSSNRNENIYSSTKGQNINTRRVKKNSPYTKHRSLSPHSTLHITSLEKSKKTMTKSQCNMPKIKSTSVFSQSKLSSKLEKSIRTSKPDIETTSKFNNIGDLKSIRTRAGLKSLLHKNETSFIKESYLTENSSSGLKSKNRTSSNHILSHNISSTECLDQLNSKHSEKVSISLNTINTPVCCHNYSIICCKRSKCILKERLSKKERYTMKNNRLANTSISEAKHRKFESTKTSDFIDNKKIRMNSDIEQFSSNSLRKSNLTIIGSKLKEHNVGKIFNPDINFLNGADEINNHQMTLNYLKNDRIDRLLDIQERKVSKKKRKRKEADLYKIMKIQNEMCKKKCHSLLEFEDDIICNSNSLSIDDRGDLRTELSRRRAERLNKLLPIQSTRLLQSAFQEVVNETTEKSLRTNRKCFFKDHNDYLIF